MEQNRSVVEHLLHQNLVLHRGDLDGLAKTPGTTLRAPFVSAPPPATSQNNTATHLGRQTVSINAQQPDRMACCAWWGPRRWRWWRGGRVVEAGRERSRSGLGALKSTGSRHHVPRSATSARAPSCQDVSHQLQPAAAPDLSHYRPAAPASPVIAEDRAVRLF